ncbi:hypothetical protein TRFO_35741 [Tritrichomonas foetus]|uniref:Uncharacterized protein n=1 Tax=Tritrichomonas foetus TaxID=1144522 RepID=A0A1J4JI49_9EUKA|nr:hypothetical protein TRFO_35741 [Tritrichomonas foetus]|eukprot:OHS97943.1 hypothetical protein TRFO_35741 [Tritrichomonas foetus]
MKSTKHFSAPSSLTIGLLAVEQILRQDSEPIDTKTNTEYLLTILDIFDLDCLKQLMSVSFQILQDANSSSAHKEVIKVYISTISLHFQKSAKFRSQIVSFFDSLPNLPVNLLQSLPLSSSIILTALSCSSRFQQIAKLFLSTKMLPNATEETYKEIDESVLYDMFHLKLKNLTFDKVQLSEQYFNSVQTIPSKDDRLFDNTNKINPSLYDAVIESDTRSLTTPIQLRRLFDFFNEFDSKHAASFILAVSSQKCAFRAYFSRLEETQRGRIVDLFRDSFTERKVDVNTITASLDLPYVSNLDPEGCSLALNLLQGLLKDQQLNGHPFVTEWQNKHLQLQFLTFLSNNDLSGFVFQNCKMTALNGFEPPDIPNKCWLCIDYVDRILKYSDLFHDEVTQMLSSAVDKFSSVILLTYAQLNPEHTEIFKKSSTTFLSSIIQNHNSTGILDILWTASPKFCHELFTLYYHSYPNKLGLIIDTLQNHLNDLLGCNDINFVLDLAFQASLRGLVDLSNFLSTLPQRFSPSAYNIALTFVKTMVLDSSISSPVLLSKPLNTFFSYFWDVFETLSSETKLLVNTVYSICETSIPSIKKFAFADSLPSIHTPEVKSTAADYFSKFVSNEMGVEQFVQLFHQLRGSSQTLFQSMVHYLLMETKYVDRHDISTINRLGELVGHMIHENLMDEQQMKQTFASFVQGFTTNSPLTKFSISALEICASKLTKQPEFVFALLKQPMLRSTPQLYDRIRKLSANLSAPVNLAKTTTLTLHPRLIRFEKLPTPLPRVCKLIQQIPSDPSIIMSIITSYQPHIDWLALHLVSTIQDHPKLLDQLLSSLLGAPQFTRIVIQAAIFESIQLITSPQFSTIDGSFARRRLSILGKLIGQLTLAVNRTISGCFLDIKQLLLYAFSQGKLFGVVPFVAEILTVASPYFNPPNPYTSGILQVLSSIGMTDLLKLSIKNDVFRILNHFDVSPCQMHLIDLIPDVRQGNFDFIATPFELNYVLSPSDIDRVVQFDESVFATLAAQSIIIPDPPQPNQNRDKMRTAITSGAFLFLKSEGTSLAKVAASTASGLILKDFALCNNVDLMMETASVLTKQLSAGLTLVTAFQKLHRLICHQVQHELGNADAEWINSCVQANNAWIGQMLQEVVHIRSLKQVQRLIEQHEESKRSLGPRYYDSMSQTLRQLPPGFAPIEQGLTVEHRQIYENLAELPLNPAEISLPETGDKTIRSSEPFEKFFVQMTKLISTEINQQGPAQDVLVDESAFSVMMSNCPPINPVFEEFLSIIKVMMKYMAKVNHNINDRIYGSLLKKVVSSVPKAFVTKAQSYVIGWLRNSIPSISLLVTMIQNELITTQQLDQFFFTSLNKQPFNYRLFVFAIRFLDSTLVQSNTIKPADLISSLTLVVSTPLSMLESTTPQQKSSAEALKKVLDELDIPLNVLSPESKLQSMSTFDPIEEICEVDTIIAAFNRWKAALEDESSDDQKLLNTTKECCQLGRDFFVIVLYTGTAAHVSRLILSIREAGCMEQAWASIASAFVYLIEGNAMVLKYDMKKYFDAMIALVNAITDDFKLTCQFADLLHALRPLAMPSFAFAWIQIACERHFVLTMLSQNEGWDRMGTILADFVASLVYASDMHVREVFDMLYKSFLRFLLVLAHDFQDFLASFAPELASILPPSLVQLHNIVLSAAPSTTKFQPFNPKQMLKTPGIDDFNYMPQPSKNMVEKLKFDVALKALINNDSAAIDEFRSELEQKCSHVLMSAFVVYATNSLLPQVTAQQIMTQSFEQTHLNTVICELARKFRPDAAMLFLNAVVDMVRYPCRATLFFMRTALILLRTPASTTGELKCDELLVRIILERASTPPPHPWGFRILVKMMLSDSQLSLYEKPYVKGVEPVLKFLKVTEEAFGGEK